MKVQNKGFPQDLESSKNINSSQSYIDLKTHGQKSQRDFAGDGFPYCVWEIRYFCVGNELIHYVYVDRLDESQ